MPFIGNEIRVEYPDVYEIITSHHQKYCWIPFDYDGPAWELRYFLEKIKKIIKSRIEIDKKIREIRDGKSRLRKLQKKYESELNFSKNKQLFYFFEIARELLFLKDYRKDALYKSYYHMDKLINEIGRRLSLSPIQVKHILPQEMEDALIKRKYVEAELNERIGHSVLLYKNAKKGQHPQKPIQIFTGKKAGKIIRKKIKTENIDSKIRKMSGQTAYPGIAGGRIKLIFSADDLNKMKYGDILVSPATNPNLLLAMKKASAIITDEGGITCHAAIVARELKIPCIIGTKIATQVLKDGDLVEVDADSGVVRILEKAKK
ncbi:MAG: PEP-utilizing enzyme [Candidatus Moranbacteria bacterium]|nr:PEP-utilizing enzyme [Candidatus Moranbacteria bacterium]